MDKIKNLINHVIEVIEGIICIVVILGIGVAFLGLVPYFQQAVNLATCSDFYEAFRNFLGYALMLIVGIEFIYMIVDNSIESLLDLLLFLIARKMLIYSHTTIDLLYGALAIAVIFLIRRFLVAPPQGGADTFRPHFSQLRPVSSGNIKTEPAPSQKKPAPSQKNPGPTEEET